MVRINLLPAEILERRKYERFYPYVFVAAAIVLGIIVVAWVVLQMLVGQQNRQLQQTQQTVSNLQAQAGALAVFEQQSQELQARQNVVRTALGGRVNMGKIMEEISLILPDDVWVDEVRLEEATGAELRLNTANVAEQKLTNSYKAIAGTLVRLNSLEDLYDVWLTKATADGYEDFEGSQAGGSARVVRFETTAKISLPPTNTPSAVSSVPAPPTTTTAQ